MNLQPSETAAIQEEPVPAGAFDGLKILRYAHIYRDRSSGGVEQYLRRLDRALLERHDITIFQMCLSRSERDEAPVMEPAGRGRIVWIPVPVCEMAPTLARLPARLRYLWRRLPRVRGVLRHGLGHLRYGAMILSDRLPALVAQDRIHLVSLHWMSYDTAAVLSYARRDRVPFVYINHFGNERFARPELRKWLPFAAAIGGVSDRSVPDDLRRRYHNLSDAVDCEFFAPERARPLHAPDPVVLLPARIQTGKGHLDLLEAARLLADRKVVIAFAGGVDSEPLLVELQHAVRTLGLDGRVLFLGEKRPEELRDWYAASRVVVLPSHSEGLGRVLLEAQAMEKPVVAYDSGGIGEAFLPDRTGYLVSARDVRALAGRIAHLLDSDAERIRFGERGRQFVSSAFGIAQLLRRHEAFYLQALAAADPENG